MPYMKRTTVYLPDALKQRVERVARERRVSEAELIRSAIDEFTRTDARPRPSLPLFDSIGEPTLAARVDDVLAESFGRD
jgi:Arc/MetJ-type ribon-helix-helix transcriptional regulator